MSNDYHKAEKHAKERKWPANCLWPKPIEDDYDEFWAEEDAEWLKLDVEAEDLLSIKDYMDTLVLEGRLNEDYSLNQDYVSDAEDDSQNERQDEWEPEIGFDYWGDGFEYEVWKEEFAAHITHLKLPLLSPADEIQRITDYDFINENLLRQAFTRRAFGIEYGVGDSERLELIGDTVLNTVVTMEMARQLTKTDSSNPATPFTSSCSEGDLSKIRAHYVCKEYLSSCAVRLRLDRFILYGPGEEPSDSSREDAIEALIGAVAVDSNWNWPVLETVTDKLLTIQFSDVDDLLHPSYYDIFNSWHQKRFGQMPDYDVSKGVPVQGKSDVLLYRCTLRYSVPDNKKGIRTSQRVDVQKESRSQARELAAEEAYRFVVNHGLWMQLSDSGIIPNLEDAINQLQELFQKKYTEKPEYHFEEQKDLTGADVWYCTCHCSGIEGWGRGTGKTKAKKKASFMVLVRLMKSAGICEQEWEDAMWENI